MISKPDKLEILSAMADYLSVEKGFAENTVISYCRDLKIFFAYLETVNGDFVNFTEDDVRDFMRVRTENGISALSIRRSLASLMSLINFYRAEDLRQDDPIANIERPKRSRNLPKVMSEQTVELFLNAPDVETFIGLRDRAMLELLYSCGLRVTELCNLKFADLHLSESYIIIHGKGNTERMIPMTKICASWIEAYIKKGRMLKDPHFKCHYVFLSTKTTNDVPKPMSRISFWFRIKYYSEQLGIDSAPSPHTFRHAFATHLLNHDADLRSLQLLLGHKSLTTTQIYTHVALARMHNSYDMAHPRAMEGMYQPPVYAGQPMGYPGQYQRPPYQGQPGGYPPGALPPGGFPPGSYPPSYQGAPGAYAPPGYPGAYQAPPEQYAPYGVDPADPNAVPPYPYGGEPIGAYQPGQPQGDPIGAYQPGQPQGEPIGAYQPGQQQGEPIGAYQPGQPQGEPIGAYQPVQPGAYQGQPGAYQPGQPGVYQPGVYQPQAAQPGAYPGAPAPAGQAAPGAEQDAAAEAEGEAKDEAQDKPKSGPAPYDPNNYLTGGGY